MVLSRNTQYILAGALAVYIVFFTRPAPSAVVNLLSSPLSQLAVLGLVVFVGAQVSLLVAVVAAIAVVLSIPGREYLSMSDDAVIKRNTAAQRKAHNNIVSINKKLKNKNLSAKERAALEKALANNRKAEAYAIKRQRSSRANKAKRSRSRARSRSRSRSRRKSPKAANSVKSKFTNPGAEGFDVMGGGPEPAGDLGVPMAGESKGSENFSLLNSSPF